MKTIFLVSIAVATAGVALFLSQVEQKNGEGQPSANGEGQPSAIPEKYTYSKRVIPEPAQSAPLSRRQILENLPESTPVMALHGVTQGQREKMDIYRQLGAHDGEEAMDFLLEFYGQGSPGLAFAMSFALTGWMEKDFEGAMDGYRKFLRNRTGIVPLKATSFNDANLFQWKGKDFHSALV